MQQAQLSPRLTVLLAASVGVLAANLYYAQPLAVQIASSLGLEVAAAGLAVTLTQAGYGAGVLFLVPLADLVENRRVILACVALTVFSLLLVGLSHQLTLYFVAAFLIGFGASCVQVIVPYATHLSPAEVRGQVVGRLMSGLMLGIMFSRPIAGFLSQIFSWHAVFYFSAGALSLIFAALVLRLPKRDPGVSDLNYGRLLSSMTKLFFQYPVLRRRALYQASMFSAFCLFWTASPILLSGPQFHLSQYAIAVFALVGVTGAVFAPFAGKLADRGLTRRATIFSFAVGSISFLLSQVSHSGSALSLTLLTIAAVMLDAGVSGNLVLGQRAIFTLPSELRARLNSIYVATIFIGGSFGSFIGAWAYAHGGWSLAAWIGFALPTAGFLYFLTER